MPTPTSNPFKKVTMPDIPALRRADLAPLFANCRPSYLIEAILEGHMGQAYVDDPQGASSAMLRLGELAIFGGDAESPAVTEWLATLEPVVGVWPPEPAWLPALQRTPGHRLIEQERWSLSSETLDGDQLHKLAASLPAELDLVPIDRDLARRIPSALETNNQIHNYGSPEGFVSLGFGYALTQGEQIVAAVSTFAHCARGVEIQINVHPDFRRQGLATGLAAHFVLECLARGLDPHWDAGNPQSMALAHKLGYGPAEAYIMPVLVPAG